MNYFSSFLRYRSQLLFYRPSICRRSYCKFRSGDLSVLKYLKRQTKDKFAKDARAHNYRARSAFKLIEMNERFRIFRRGSVVLDVGAAPGSWCQVLSETIFEDAPKEGNFRGYVLGVDIQYIQPLPHVDVIAPGGDITAVSTQAEIRHRLADRCLDAIISDMAPNPTGNSSNDHERILRLCRTLFQLLAPPSTSSAEANNCDDVYGTLPLRHGGKFLCKIWDGADRQVFVDELAVAFRDVRLLKPEASRESSAESYILASGYGQWNKSKF